MTDLLLRYSHNVVEHLGLKLYQNRPTRVIAEIVSNSWDADAKNVAVNMAMDDGPRWVAVCDDGHGMTRQDLASAYLIIGHGRRANPADRSRGKRRLMGRKGIGKLAPFGIARFVDVVTSAVDKGDLKAHWLRFDLHDLLNQKEGEGSYPPEHIYDGGTLEDIPVNKDTTGQIKKWRDALTGLRTGTVILMTSLSISKAINESQLLDSLGTRFTITLRPDFSVTVNGNLATSENALPECEFRIPDTGTIAESVDGHDVRYWVGFVKSASWPQDHAGVGVYSHGKIAQDRPFTFGVKGKEIFTRYMFGVVEADWLDEFGTDLISTDRTSVNWEAPEVTLLHDWGQGKVREWVAAFERWRQEEEQGDNRGLVKRAISSGIAAKVTEPEEEEIIRLVSDITPSFGKDESAKERLV